MELKEIRAELAQSIVELTAQANMYAVRESDLAEQLKDTQHELELARRSKHFTHGAINAQKTMLAAVDGELAELSKAKAKAPADPPQPPAPDPPAAQPPALGNGQDNAPDIEGRPPALIPEQGAAH